MLLQATGTILVGAVGYLVLAAIVLGGRARRAARSACALFDREAILTRWRRRASSRRRDATDPASDGSSGTGPHTPLIGL